MQPSLQRRSRSLLRAAALPFFALVAACTITPGDGTSTPPKVVGALGRGSFYFVCSPTAISCPTEKKGSTKPVALATGGRIRVRFQRTDSTTSTDSVRAVSPEAMAHNEDGTFVALKPGLTSIAAMTSIDEVLDFAVVSVARPARMDFTTKNIPYDRNVHKITVHMGNEVPLSAELFDDYDVHLAGDITYTFTSGTPAVVRLENLDDRSTNVVPVSVGTSHLTVEGAGLKRELELEVVQ